ncbi:MAG: trypsin-like serine protease [Deltaproteobacteria bacterium]|nr:trypsin-like serine protease [Deltaproteobacteria bacterium]
MITVLLVGCQSPAVDPIAASGSTITNGVDDTEHPYVGLLLVGAEGGTAKTVCTATLVGPRTLLTATHCLKDEPLNFFQLAGKLHVVEGFSRRDDWQPTVTIHLHDIGLAHLKDPINDVQIAYLASRPPEVGEEVTLVGFGVTSSGLEVPDAGRKRVARNKVDVAGEEDFEISGSGEGEGNICAGDSGGPALAVIGGREVVVGVASATQEPCGQRSWYVAVSAYEEWLRTSAQGDLGEPGALNDASAVDGVGAIVDSVVVGGLGASCVGDANCESGFCRRDPVDGRLFCTQACGPELACPSSSDCIEVETESICTAQATTTQPVDGCNFGADLAGGSTNRGVGFWLLALLTLAFRAGTRV